MSDQESCYLFKFRLLIIAHIELRKLEADVLKLWDGLDARQQHGLLDPRTLRNPPDGNLRNARD